MKRENKIESTVNDLDTWGGSVNTFVNSRSEFVSGEGIPDLTGFVFNFI